MAWVPNRSASGVVSVSVGIEIAADERGAERVGVQDAQRSRHVAVAHFADR